MVDLLVIGDCSIDQLMVLDKTSLVEYNASNLKNKTPEVCFVHGSKIPVQEMYFNFGGNACHVSIGASRLGLKTAIYTELGKDDNGEQFLKLFKKNKVNVKNTNLNPTKKTNVHSIFYYKSERTILSFHEVYNYKLNFKALSKPKWIYYTSLAKGFETFQQSLVDYVTKNPEIGVAFNPGTYQLNADLKHLTNILKVTNVVFVNKQEAQKITRNYSQDLLKLHISLNKLGPQISVITDGKNGASAYDSHELTTQTTDLDNKLIVDKTGAGDAYATGFLGALHYKKSIKEAMEWGQKNSNNVIQHIGAIDSLLTKTQIQRH